MRHVRHVTVPFIYVYMSVYRLFQKMTIYVCLNMFIYTECYTESRRDIQDNSLKHKHTPETPNANSEQH